MADIRVISPGGKVGSIPEANLDAARNAGYRVAEDEGREDQGSTAEVRSPTGQVGTIPRANVEAAKSAGFEVISGETPVGGGGLGTDILAGLAGAARGVSFSLSDIGLAKLGVDPETLRDLERESPVVSNISEIGGAIGSLFIPVPGARVAGAAKITSLARAGHQAARVATAAPRAAAQLGTKVTSLAAKALGTRAPTGLAARTLAKGIPLFAGSAVEGSLYGLGEAVTEAAIGEREITAQRFMANVGLSALLSGGLGGAIGVTAPLLKKAGEGVLSTIGPTKAGITMKEWLAGLAERRAEKTITHKVGRTKKIREKEKQVGETVTGQTEGAAGRYLLDNEIVSLKNNDPKEIYRKILEKAEEVENRYYTMLEEVEAGSKKIGERKLIDAKVVADEIRNRLVKPIRGNVARRGEIDALEAEIEAIASEGAFTFKQANKIRRSYQDKGRFDMLTPAQSRESFRSISRIFNDSIDNKVDDLIAKGAVGGEKGALRKIRQEFALIKELEDHALDNVEQLASNRVISPSDYGFGMAGGLASTMTGDPSAAIGMAKGMALALGHGQARKRGAAVVADIANRLSKIESSSSKVAKKTYDAAQRLTENLARGGRTLIPKISAISSADTVLGGAKMKKKDKGSHYEQITRFTNNPERMMEHIVTHVAPIYDVAPMIAQQMQLNAVKAMGFLKSKLPQPPPMSGLNAAAKMAKWRPSKSAMAKFDRYAEAVNSPIGVIERIGKGTISDEGVEVLKSVYPKIYDDLVGQLLENLPSYQDKLTNSDLESLSRLLGVPLAPTQDLEFQRAVQISLQGVGFGSMEQQASQGRKPKVNISARTPTAAEATKPQTERLGTR